jgi:hypothetical protein
VFRGTGNDRKNLQNGFNLSSSFFEIRLSQASHNRNGKPVLVMTEANDLLHAGEPRQDPMDGCWDRNLRDIWEIGFGEECGVECLCSHASPIVGDAQSF